jgi:hypothetical protein
MASASKTLPRPGELWLSCPPYLAAVQRAVLDRDWWRTFQLLAPRFG